MATTTSVTKSYFPVYTGRYGFLSSTDTQLTFDGTNLFTLAPISSTFTYYRNGLKIEITGSKTVTLPGSPVATGKYYIYIDDDLGTLTQSTSAWTLNDTKVPVAIIYFDNTMTPKFIMMNERHSVLLDRRWHMYHHYTHGTEYASGAALTGYTLNTATDAGNTFGIDASNIFDEDMYLTLSALADGNGSGTPYRIMYRTAATTYAWLDSSVPFYYTGASAPYSYLYYDNAGTMTAAINNRFVNYFVVLTNSIVSNEATQGTSTCACRYTIIPGRTLYTSAATAYGETFSSFTMTGLPFDEAIAVWQITYDTGGVANTVKGRCQINRVARVNSNILTSTASSSSAHNLLVGLQGGTTNEYYHLTATEWGNLAGTGSEYLFSLAEISLSAAVGGTAYASLWLCPRNIPVTKLAAYFTNSGNETVTIGVYSYDGTTLLCSGTITANPGIGVRSTSSFTAVNLVTGTLYYLAIIATNSGGTSNHGYQTIYGDGIICKSKYIGDTGLPANLTGFTTDTKGYWIGLNI